MTTDGVPNGTQGAGGGTGGQQAPFVPPPGYGYPLQPPAPPQAESHAAPQAAPQAPVQPPAPASAQAPVPAPQGPPPQQYGYGAPPTQAPQPTPPQAPPQGYGFPQHPSQGQGQAQGYGFPQQPPQKYGWGGPAGPIGPGGAGGPGGPAGPGGLPQQGAARKKPVGLILVLVMALLVLGGAGFGAWYMFVGSSSNNVYWSVPAVKQGDMSNGQLMPETRGTWFTDEAVVHVLPDGIKAYDIDNGKELWGTPLPGDSNQTCVAPENSNGDIGVVAYGAGRVCDHLVAYDLNTGKAAWDKALHPGEDALPSDISVARTEDVVVVTAGNAALALKASDGKAAWDPKRSATSECRTGRFTGGKALIRVRGCISEDFKTEWNEVSLIDPATGKAQWTYRHEAPDGSQELDNAGVISTSPIVLARQEPKQKALFALDDKTGKVRSEFSPAQPARYVQTQDAEGSPWSEAGAFGDTFVISVTDEKNRALLVAYDLDSGKQLWKTEPEEFKSYHPLPAAGSDRILVYMTKSGNDAGPELVEFGAQDGAMSTVVEYPEDVDKGMSTFARPYWNEDRLYVSVVNHTTTFDEESYSLVALPATD